MLTAARSLFEERGWSATGMRDVAKSAGVAVETIYAGFGTKTDLLLAALDVNVVGVDEPVPLAGRDEFALLTRGDLRERARSAARLAHRINDRTRPLNKALTEAAASDPELAKRQRETDRRRRLTVADGARMVAARRVSTTERDGLWAVLSVEVYDLLVHRSGWSGARYERWLADSIVALLSSTKDGR